MKSRPGSGEPGSCGHVMVASTLENMGFGRVLGTVLDLVPSRKGIITPHGLDLASAHGHIDEMWDMSPDQDRIRGPCDNARHACHVYLEIAVDMPKEGPVHSAAHRTAEQQARQPVRAVAQPTRIDRGDMGEEKEAAEALARIEIPLAPLLPPSLASISKVIADIKDRVQLIGRERRITTAISVGRGKGITLGFIISMIFFISLIFIG